MAATKQNSPSARHRLLSVEGDNPAGPLFAGAGFAAADIVGSNGRSTACSICSGSHTVACC